MKHPHLEIGSLGEEVACRFLRKNGYSIIERNFRKKQGEIDIIAQIKRKIHFFEVKTVSCEILSSNVPYKTSNYYRPEDNIHFLKLKRLSHTISLYLEEREYDNVDWSLGAISVHLDRKRKRAKIDLIEDISL